MKLLIWNVVRDAELDFNCISQAVEDSAGVGMKPEHIAVVLIPHDADSEAVATALEEIADDLRKYGTPQLYKVADHKS